MSLSRGFYALCRTGRHELTPDNVQQSNSPTESRFRRCKACRREAEQRRFRGGQTRTPFETGDALPIGPTPFTRPLSDRSAWKLLPMPCSLCHVQDSKPYVIIRTNDAVQHVVHLACSDTAKGKLSWPKEAA